MQTLETPKKPRTWTPAATKPMIPNTQDEKLGVADPTTAIQNEEWHVIVKMSTNWMA